MANHDVEVETFTVKVRVTITRYEMDGGEADKFDWVASNGDESHELFDSAEEARADAEGYYG